MGIGCNEGWAQRREEEKQVPRWIENCTTKQSARLYHKFDNTRGSDFARVVVAKLDAVETMEEELVDIARVGW